jgi:hypothetical protein
MRYADCPENLWWCGLISDEAMALLSWLGALATIVGFAIAIQQAIKARRSADAARNAVDRLKIHVDAANTAYAGGQLSTLVHLVNSGDFRIAGTFFAPIKRSLRVQAHARASSSEVIADLSRLIRTIDRHLELASSADSQFKPQSLHRAIDGLQAITARWESQLEVSSIKGIMEDEA